MAVDVSIQASSPGKTAEIERQPNGRPPLEAGPGQSPAGPASKGRVLSLDVLRAVAIFLVLGRHTVAPIEGLGAATPLFAAWTRIGWSGVDLFFVLSGYLVSGLLFGEYQKNGRVDLRRFLVRRAFKIWPPYLAYLGFVALWLAWKHRHGEGLAVWPQLWPNLFHVQNYFGTPRVHTWSLAVEEHFYLVAALCFYLLLGGRGSGGRLRHFPWFVALTGALLVVCRSVAFVHAGPGGMNIYATHLRFDGLLVGTLLAYLSCFRPTSLAFFARRPWQSIAVGLALAAPTLYYAPEYNLWTAGLGLSALYAGYGLLLVGWINLPVHTSIGSRFFGTGFARALGAIGFFSYSIYLWHIDLAQTPIHKVAAAAARRGVAPGIVYLCANAVYILAAIAFGWIMARALEKPSLALRDRLFPAAVKSTAAGKAAAV
jgi:peptidoglycan/LPS O-acetylase OafA/YrhL